MMTAPIIPIVKHCDWGKTGRHSIVAQLTGHTDENPYAELWMGTHPSGPSIVRTHGMLLKDSLSAVTFIAVIH